MKKKMKIMNKNDFQNIEIININNYFKFFILNVIEYDF